MGAAGATAPPSGRTGAKLPRDEGMVLAPAPAVGYATRFEWQCAPSSLGLLSALLWRLWQSGLRRKSTGPWLAVARRQHRLVARLRPRFAGETPSISM